MKTILGAALFASALSLASAAVAPAEAAFIVPSAGLTTASHADVQEAAFVRRTVRTHIGPRGRVCRSVVRTVHTRHGVRRSVTRVCR